ncbi:MAG: GDP-mannose 4,6-dehydratase [Akkermansiaceae bacterium]|nr:GDP-mannose 4,6-dehydratase [Akkermansiaceae bacterium]
MKTPRQCLITGGCGFLGSNLAAHFLGSGSRVVVIDALFRTGGESNLQWLRDCDPGGQFEFIKGDLADGDLVDSVFRDHGPFDYICHLGGQVAMTTSLENPRRDFLTNAQGTFNVLEAMRAYSPDALLAYSSTNKVYGDLNDFEHEERTTRFVPVGYEDGFDESLRLDFASPYGCSKGSADQYVRDWNRNFGLKTVVFRHSSIYGGRQFSTFDQGWIGWFCRQALLQERDFAAGREPSPFTIAGTGKQVRDVLHAEDLVSLYQAAFEHRDTCAGEIFNIGGGAENSLSLLELFSALRDLLGLQRDLVFERLPVRQSDQRFFVADISKASRLLGWKPRVSAREGLGRMLEWTRQGL